MKNRSMKSWRKPDRFEDLRAAIALQRRDPHLRHHLQNALVERLDVVRDGGVIGDACQHPLMDHVADRLEGQIGIDDTRAVSEQQRHSDALRVRRRTRRRGAHRVRVPSRTR